MDTSVVGASENAENFRRRMNQTVVSAAVTMGISLGLELGLFHVLCQTDLDTAISSQELADQTGCDERYVREWMIQMTAAEVLVKIDGRDAYRLPSERRAVFQTPGTLVTGVAPMITTLAQSHERLLRCFQTGESEDAVEILSCSKLMRTFEEQRDKYFAILFSKVIFPNVQGLEEILDAGTRLCDVGCGRGKALLTFAKRFPRSHFFGVDISDAVIEESRMQARGESLINLTFERLEVPGLPENWSGKFDVVTMFLSLHDFSKATEALTDAKRILREGGLIIVVELAFHSRQQDNLRDPILRESLTFMSYLSMNYCVQFSKREKNSAALGGVVGKETIHKLLTGAGFKDVTMTDFQLLEGIRECLMVGHK